MNHWIIISSLYMLLSCNTGTQQGSDHTEEPTTIAASSASTALKSDSMIEAKEPRPANIDTSHTVSYLNLGKHIPQKGSALHIEAYGDSLRFSLAKEGIKVGSAYSYFTAHRSILSTSQKELAKTITSYSLHEIGPKKAKEIANYLKKTAGNKVMKSLTAVYVGGALVTAAYNYFNSESGSNKHSQKLFEAPPKQ